MSLASCLGDWLHATWAKFNGNSSRQSAGLSSTENPRRDFRDYKQHLPAFKNFPPLNYNINSLHQNHHRADFSSASHFHSGYLYTSAIGLHCIYNILISSQPALSATRSQATCLGQVLLLVARTARKVLQTTIGLGWACILSKCFVNSILIQRTYRDLLQTLIGAWPS